MSAILEIPEVRRRVSHLSVAEYHRLDEFNENGRRTELIRGIVIEKVDRRPERGRYQEMRLFGPDGVLECAGLPSVRIRVSDLFA